MNEFKQSEIRSNVKFIVGNSSCAFLPAGVISDNAKDHPTNNYKRAKLKNRTSKKLIFAEKYSPLRRLHFMNLNEFRAIKIKRWPNLL